MEKSSKYPSEVVKLPSRGLIYPLESPLSSGEVEMKYMTAREEDILTNQNYITQGIVIDKLLQSLLVTKFNYDELLIGDKNAILLAARILGYGANYTFSVLGEEYTVDLSEIEAKDLDESIYSRGKNEFSFTLPASETKIKFQLLTTGLEKSIQADIKGNLKIDKDNPSELTTRLKHLITAVDGNTETKTIGEFVDNYLLARDSRALREYIKEVQPDVNAKFYPDGGPIGGVDIPFGINFLWPDS